MMRKLLFIPILLLLYSCGEQALEQTKLDKLNWLLGYWTYTTPGGTITEAWLKENGNKFSGEGKSLDSTGKVLFTEHIEIQLKENKLYYVPSVSNQNNGKAIEFTEQSYSDTLIVFENLQHDFPQRIAYHKTSDSTLTAYIEGEIDSQVNRIEFYYIKN